MPLDPDTDILDWPACVALAADQPALAQEMIALFLADLPRVTRCLEEHFQAADTAAYRDCVHQLLGGCCYVRVPLLHAAVVAIHDASWSQWSEIHAQHEMLMRAIAITFVVVSEAVPR